MYTAVFRGSIRLVLLSNCNFPYSRYSQHFDHQFWQYFGYSQYQILKSSISCSVFPIRMVLAVLWLLWYDSTAFTVDINIRVFHRYVRRGEVILGAFQAFAPRGTAGSSKHSRVFCLYTAILRGSIRLHSLSTCSISNICTASTAYTRQYCTLRTSNIRSISSIKTAHTPGTRSM